VRPGQLVVIPNGVRWTEPREPRDEMRARLGIETDAFVVAMVGVMRPGKGHAEAIAALEPLASDQGTVLLLVGAGPESDAVELLARRSPVDARLLGHRTDVPALLRAADALVLPSAVEALPTVVIEAMAAGLPVVAARGGGTPELVVDGVTGLLAPPGDVEALGAHLARLADDPPLAHGLGTGGRKRYEEELTAERWAERLRSLYDDVLTERAKRPRPRPRRQPRRRPSVDALVLDAGQRQALVAIRSLGRAGIGTCTVARFAGSPAFSSRWCGARAVVPDFEHDPDAFVDGILELLRRYPTTQVVLPSHDGSIEALRARRADVEEHAALALAREDALACAVDKARTLAVAGGLGIPLPRSLEAGDLTEARAAWREIGFPVVVKPLRSWIQNGGDGHRLTSEVVTTEAEAEDAVAHLVEDGGRVVLQEWLSGAREAVSFVYARGRIWGRFAQVAYRMTPALGGSSVLRESVAPPADIADAAERLVREIDLEGYSEIEFRRDALGRPLLMEINPRLSASVEIAVRAGVDFPRLLYAWAAGMPLEDVRGYRTGLRVRWLGGDVDWLREVMASQGRPDIPPLGEAVATFARDFARPVSYDYVDLRDPLPAVTAARSAVSGVARRRLQRHHLRAGGPR
jgi:predicted ATP-grasp superfamily ATP-dependent carboligase